MLFFAYLTLSFIFAIWMALTFQQPLASLFSEYFGVAKRKRPRKSSSRSYKKKKASKKQQRTAINDEDDDEDTVTLDSRTGSTHYLSQQLLDEKSDKKKREARERRLSVDTEDLEDMQEREIERFIGKGSSLSKRQEGVRPGISYKKK